MALNIWRGCVRTLRTTPHTPPPSSPPGTRLLFLHCRLIFRPDLVLSCANSPLFQYFKDFRRWQHALVNLIKKLLLTLANIYLSIVNNRNTRKRCEIYLKLTIKIPERRHWRRSDVFIVNFEHISLLFLVLLLLIFSK